MKKGDIVRGKVVQISRTHLIANLESGEAALLYIVEISDYYVSSISSMFEKGRWYDFVILSVSKDNQIAISWKQIVPRYLKNPFEFKLEETKNGFKNLKERIGEKND